MGTLRPLARKVDGRLMQRANRALVLNLVRSDPTLSRAAIARTTGLSPAAVTGIVDHLLREGLVREEPVTTGMVGRPPLWLSFNPGARLALGIAVGVQDVGAALVDLGGAPRSIYGAAVSPGAAPEQVLDLAAGLARRALRDAAPGVVLGAGVAVPGMVAWPEGLNLFSPNFGWHDVPVRAMMEERLQLPVLVDNEVRTLALAEYHFGSARGAQTIVFIDAGYGVGGAIIIGGSLYRGMHGAAAEVGHNTVEPGGPLCGCGNRGCLEVFASAHGLVARARDALDAGRPSVLGDLPGTQLSLGAIVEAAGGGDALARELLARAATYLGLAVANAVDNWDPELVVLSGPVVQAGGSLFDDLLATEQRSVIETGRAGARVARATLDAGAKIVGAATLIIADYLAEPLRSG